MPTALVPNFAEEVGSEDGRGRVSKACIARAAYHLVKRPAGSLECIILAWPILHVARQHTLDKAALTSCLKLAHRLSAALAVHRVASVAFHVWGKRRNKCTAAMQVKHNNADHTLAAVSPRNCWEAVLQLPRGLPPPALSSATCASDVVGHFQVELRALADSLLAGGTALPSEVFREDGLELMRYAGAAGLLKAATPEDKVAALQQAARHVREVLQWRGTYSFMTPQQLQAWGHIAWWHGSDRAGRPVLWSHAGRTLMQGCEGAAEKCSIALITQMEWGLRNLSPVAPSSGPLDQVTCVVVCQGVGLLRARRLLPLFQTTARTMNIRFPGRLHAMYLVGLPAWAQFCLRAILTLVHPDTRRKIIIAPLSALDSTLTLQLPTSTLLAASSSGFNLGPNLHAPVPLRQPGPAPFSKAPQFHPPISLQAGWGEAGRANRAVGRGGGAEPAASDSCGQGGGVLAGKGTGEGVHAWDLSTVAKAALPARRGNGGMSTISSSSSSCRSSSFSGSLSSNLSSSSLISVASGGSVSSSAAPTGTCAIRCDEGKGWGPGVGGKERRHGGGRARSLRSFDLHAAGGRSARQQRKAGHGEEEAGEGHVWEGVASHVALMGLLLGLLVLGLVRFLVSHAVSLPQLQQRVWGVVEALIVPPKVAGHRRLR